MKISLKNIGISTIILVIENIFSFFLTCARYEQGFYCKCANIVISES